MLTMGEGIKVGRIAISYGYALSLLVLLPSVCLRLHAQLSILLLSHDMADHSDRLCIAAIIVFITRTCSYTS